MSAETMIRICTSDNPVKVLALFLSVAGLASAQSVLSRYAVVLSDPPLAAEVTVPKEQRNAALADRKNSIESAQGRVRSALAERRLADAGSMQTLLNAVFVIANEEQAAELRGLPGVKAVREMRRFRRHLYSALTNMNVPAAWNQIGGQQNAGAGVKIAIIDTGIDQTHPGFQDNGLTVPAGFPKCQDSRGECAFTNRKVIVARSYVDRLTDRPDDVSPRDRVGHGTAVAMIAAGASNRGPLGTISGVAPKAFLGNYKVFGSPGVNDGTTEDVVMRAMEDAASDGMDIVVLTLGSPDLCGPNTAASVCGPDADIYNSVINNAIRSGLTVVVSAGNSSQFSDTFPGLNTIESPGASPAAITVGAIENSHDFLQSVLVDPPAATTRYNALFGNGPLPKTPLKARVRDVEKLGNDGYACSALPAGSLAGAIAIIRRGVCLRDQKVNIAQNAGAVGVIIYQPDTSGLFTMAGMEFTGIPAVLVSNATGTALKTLAAATPDKLVTLDPTQVETNNSFVNEVAIFSSRGPSVGESGIKPELVATGTGLYTATQKYDPNGASGSLVGNLYDPSGYTSVFGTSFAAPLVAGAAALVKQLRPAFTPAQIKSAVVNTASDQVDDFDSNNNKVKARVTAVGAGKLDASAALRTTVTAEPATVSFGVVGATLPSPIPIMLRNAGTAAVNLTLAVSQRDVDSKARVTVSNSTLTIAAGQSAQVTVRLEGSTPAAGSYEGAITVTGGVVPLRIPYLYLVGDGTPYSSILLEGDGFVRDLGDTRPVKLTFKLVDKFGVPVANVPVRFQSTVGSGKVVQATAFTDDLGIGQAQRVTVGTVAEEEEFAAQAGGLTVYFVGLVRPKPSVKASDVVNSASHTAGAGLAPGSYIEIYGSALSESTQIYRTAYLPISLSGVSVSFESAAKNIRVPGRFSFVSPGQLNVQIPWELQGASDVVMKVRRGRVNNGKGNSEDTTSDAVTLTLKDYAPGVFATVNEAAVPITASNPAVRGRAVVMYASGLGPLDTPQVSGEPAPSASLVRTRTVPTVTVGGRPAQVLFSGLAPGYIGLYQLNVLVPADAPTGTQLVQISTNGISGSINLPIQ